METACLRYCNNCFCFVAGQVDEKATQLHAIASLRALLDATNPNQGAASVSAARRVTGDGPSSSNAIDIEMNGIPMSSASRNNNAVSVIAIVPKRC